MGSLTVRVSDRDQHPNRPRLRRRAQNRRPVLERHPTRDQAQHVHVAPRAEGGVPDAVQDRGVPPPLHGLGHVGVVADEQVGAGRYERSDVRQTGRNGYRERVCETRVGEIPLRMPKVRSGTYFPSLLNPRRRPEKTSLIAGY